MNELYVRYGLRFAVYPIEIRKAPMARLPRIKDGIASANNWRKQDGTKLFAARIGVHGEELVLGTTINQ